MAALHLQILSTPSSYSKGLIHCRSLPQRPLNHQCIISNIKCPTTTHSSEPTSNRRSANYQRTIWDFDFVQSLKSDYKAEAYKIKTKRLEEEVKHRLDDGAMGQLGLLELIDDIQRLGLGYLFKEEIKIALDAIVCMEDMGTRTESFHCIALRFRLLRQHGYEVNQGVFNHLKDEGGNFMASDLKDTKGILSLFEASHLAVEGETILEEVKHFTRTALKEINGNIESNLAKQVNHALELPLHWRVPRLEARWYIGVYEEKENSIPALIELAKLDFNIALAIHQENVADLSRWWKDLGLGDHLTFTRDSMIQCFLWTLGMNPEPQVSDFRLELAKVNILITTIDDIYDVYGSLEELELFTDAVESVKRRETDTKKLMHKMLLHTDGVQALEQLPDYMKICFLALFNFVNEMGYFHLKKLGFNSIPFLKQAWIDLCKTYLVEAKWYYNGHKTTLDEYLDNAVISIGCIVMLMHSFFSLQPTIQKKALDCVSQYQSIVRWSSMVLRLANDLGTSKSELARGDILKSIQSYMHQTGASEDVAREHIRHMIDETWMKMNTDLFGSDFILPEPFTTTAVNVARMAQCIYQHGDGHGAIDDVSKIRANSLLFEFIPLLIDT